MVVAGRIEDVGGGRGIQSRIQSRRRQPAIVMKEKPKRLSVKK
jgi:hypothetical protein